MLIRPSFGQPMPEHLFSSASTFIVALFTEIRVVALLLG